MKPLKPFVHIFIISVMPVTLILGLAGILSVLDLSDLAIFIICLMVIAVSMAIIFTTLNMYKIQAKHQERLRMIETGMELTPERERPKDILLIIGAMAFSFGVGFVAAIFIGGYNVLILGSSIGVLLSGLSLILLFFLFSIRDREMD